MLGGQQAGFDGVGEDVLAPNRWHAVIQSGDFRQTAAEDDHVRVQQVDDMGQAAGKLVLIARHHPLRVGVVVVGPLDDLGDRHRLSGGAPIRTLQRRAAKKGFDASLASTITPVAGSFVVGRPR